MSAKDLPNEGDVFLGYGGVAKVKKVSIGVASSNDVVFDAVESLPIFNVPADTMVLEVLAYTPTAWTATDTLDIGDGTDPDGWLASAKIAPTVAQTNEVRKRSTLPTAEAYAGGKLYTAADTIDAAVGVATPVVGQTDIYIVYIPNFSSFV